MIQSDILTALLADSAVTAIVGARIYPMRIPQGADLPAIVYQKISSVPVNSLDGDSGLDSVRMQFTSWASTYSVAADLSAKVRAAINAASLKSVTNFELDTEDPETREYGSILNISIWG